MNIGQHTERLKKYVLEMRNSLLIAAQTSVPLESILPFETLHCKKPASLQQVAIRVAHKSKIEHADKIGMMQRDKHGDFIPELLISGTIRLIRLVEDLHRELLLLLESVLNEEYLTASTLAKLS
jgi:hypothetical protein